MATRCPHCHAPISKSPPILVRGLGLSAAWIVAMAMVFGASLIGPAIIILLPILVFGGIGLVTGTYAWAHGDRVCETCGRAYEIDGVAVVVAEPVADEAHGPTALAA